MILLMKNELIKDIDGYLGEYAVTSFGRVWSYKNGLGSLGSNGGFLKPLPRGGYFRVALLKNRKSRRFSIHRLVATAFISNLCNKNEVNHKDGIKTNNTVKNLEWVTSSENSIHAVKTGLHPQIHRRKLSLDEASEICEAYQTGIFSQREIGRHLNVSHNIIGNIIRGESYGI